MSRSEDDKAVNDSAYDLVVQIRGTKAPADYVAVRNGTLNETPMRPWSSVHFERQSVATVFLKGSPGSRVKRTSLSPQSTSGVLLSMAATSRSCSWAGCRAFQGFFSKRLLIHWSRPFLLISYSNYPAISICSRFLTCQQIPMNSESDIIKWKGSGCLIIIIMQRVLLCVGVKAEFFQS